VDAFNVLNHANFTAPNGGLGGVQTKVTGTAPNQTASYGWNSSSFGQITGTQGERRMQLSARFVF
jgi:hypothetical protein